MKLRRFLFLVALCTPTLLQAQQVAPELSLGVNGSRNVSLYAGWPLIVHVTIMNSSRFNPGGSATPLVIAPNGAAWTGAIQFTALSSSGQSLRWPLQLIGSPSDNVLTLPRTSYVPLTFQMSGTDVSALPPDTYQLTATLTVSNSNGWNGAAQSPVATVQVSPEPALTPNQQAAKALLIAEYQANSGDLDGALSTTLQLAQSQPTNSAAMSAAANLLQLLGYPGLAFFQGGSALQAYFQANPSLYDPPWNLLTLNQKLFTYMTTPNSSAASTSTILTNLSVNYSPIDQTATFSATITSASASVNEGMAVFKVLGVGNAVSVTPVQDNATANFTIPGGTPAGSYPIEVSYIGTPNFSPSSGSAQLAIAAVPLTIMANNATREYSQANPSFTVSYSGLPSGSPPPALTGALTCATTATLGSPVGSYPITCSGLTSTNYIIAFVPGTLTVTPDSLTVTASNAARHYGQPNPALNNATYAGFVNGDTPASLGGTLSCTTSATLTSPQGTYAITCSGLSSPNYSISFVQGILAITAVPLTITANNTTRQYGSANPPLNDATYSGFVNADGPSSLGGSLNCTSAATQASPVGAYSITCSGLTSANYVITFVSGTLTITPAVVTITANNAIKVLNVPNPALTWTASGFVNGDTTSVLAANPMCGTTALTNSPVGSYPITCAGASAASYTFSYVAAKLKVQYATAIGHVIQPPINPDGSSVFNQGRTIPAKFSVYDANGVSIGTPGVVSSFFLTGIVSGTTTTTVEDVADTNNPDTSFRWDPTNQQWIFNITTGNLSAGNTYIYTIALNDGSTITFQYGLR